MAPSEDFLFRDGLGDRLIVRGAHGRPANECLLIRTELSAVPAFEFALNERLWLLERFDNPAFLTVRNILRAPGRLTSISLVHDLTGGTRLSEVLEQAASGSRPISIGATLFVLKEVLDALADLHRESGDLAHGAIAPDRIVLANGKVRIADYVLGSAIEQLRYTPERYWKELRVAAPSAAGGARLDRCVDVAQAALMAVAMFAGRPLRDAEHLGSLGDVLIAISLPQPIRSWLLKALHMDPRRVFVHAGEASHALAEAMSEAALRASPGDLELQESRSSKGVAPMPVAPRPITAAPAKTVALPKPAAAARAPRRDVWEAPDVDQHVYLPRVATIKRARRSLMSEALKKYLLPAAIIGLMAVAFTVAQFISVPEWMFAQNGTLIVESSPQGVKVLVNGKPQGVTPLTLKVESGVHEVELHGPGKPKIFKVHVTRGDRVAQYVEFPGR